VDVAQTYEDKLDGNEIEQESIKLSTVAKIKMIIRDKENQVFNTLCDITHLL